MADVSVLLTTLWYTETTDAKGNPFTPVPDVYCISYPPMADSQNLKERELARRIFDHNSWADRQKGRPHVKETLQQVVIMTKPVEQDEQSQLARDIAYSKKWADIYDQDKQDLY